MFLFTLVCVNSLLRVWFIYYLFSAHKCLVSKLCLHTHPYSHVLFSLSYPVSYLYREELCAFLYSSVFSALLSDDNCGCVCISVNIWAVFFFPPGTVIWNPSCMACMPYLRVTSVYLQLEMNGSLLTWNC